MDKNQFKNMDECAKCHMPLDDNNRCSCSDELCMHCCECEPGCSCGCKEDEDDDYSDDEDY